jgi:[ribosomal protein S5]-alanine N-acetyltransferase
VKTIQLIAVDQSGIPPSSLPVVPEFVKQTCELLATFYTQVGFEPPWIGYVAVHEGEPVGGGGFKGPPQDNRVEIAYYTLPDLEGRGFASATARELIRIARETRPGITVAAQTLPEPNASNSLLKKLGFEFKGSLIHPEDGEVWEWQLLER